MTYCLCFILDRLKSKHLDVFKAPAALQQCGKGGDVYIPPVGFSQNDGACDYSVEANLRNSAATMSIAGVAAAFVANASPA